MAMLLGNLRRQLTLDEGRKHTAYQDHLGFWTIGVGRLIDDRKTSRGLRDVEIDFMLQNDIEDRMKELMTRLAWFSSLDEARQGVLLNMSFQLGVAGLLGFTRTLQAVALGEYNKAADFMLESKWATQTPIRAKRLAEQMRTGEWQFAGE